MYTYNNLMYASNSWTKANPFPGSQKHFSAESDQQWSQGADSHEALATYTTTTASFNVRTEMCCPKYDPYEPVNIWIEVVLPAWLITRKETGVTQKGIHQLTTSEITQPNDTNNSIPQVWVVAIFLLWLISVSPSPFVLWCGLRPAV